ncbi:MAG: ABC transporter [Rhodospirillaceae bacterium TMED8]|nr:ABC transporter [Magnetovibrio sp.]OUT51180.1 MAG: ABC transporter [Rhodospirillaceae bacterium TMED8]|tara:strand:+ start:583 stop:1326 length:744 start_codon:yes stop_codon:yes gene_type:complete
MTPAIDFQNLTLGYDRHPAVSGLHTKIKAGSLTAIVGPNGAGKTTLLKGLTGTLMPLKGKVLLGSLSRENIAYLPQQSEIDRSFPLSVIDIVAMGLWREIGAFGWLGKERSLRVDAAIASVGLTGFETRAIGSLSGGQMQRALFARLLLQNAELVLLDEPFVSVDSRTMADLIELIQSWHIEGRTVIAVLHDNDLVRKHFPDTLMLARQLVGHGPTEQVLTEENQFRARQMCEACEGPPHVCGRDAA